MGTPHTERSDRRAAVQSAALVVAALFVVTGIAGFIPGITRDAPGDFAGEDSPASLLHVFQTGILHNLVHLAFGLVGIAMARRYDTAKQFLIGGGLVYLLLWLIGMFSAMDWLPADVSDHWLHFVLGLAMVGLGWALTRRLGIDDRDRRERATA